jgi:hypothetical protein
MPRTELNAAPSKASEAALDDALDDSFPASDPLSSTPQRAGQHDKTASTTDAVRPHTVHPAVNGAVEQQTH